MSLSFIIPFLQGVLCFPFVPFLVQWESFEYCKNSTEIHMGSLEDYIFFYDLTLLFSWTVMAELISYAFL